MSIQGKWIQIQAYKHNEELHRQWSYGYVLEETEDYFCVVSVRAAVVENDGRKWHAKEPALFILFKNKWMNVISMLKDDGVCFYVNLASPTVYDGKFLKYIDYDLDVKLFSNGSTKLLDVSEFKKHSEEQNYGDELKKILSSTLNDIYSMMKNKEYPFQPEVIERKFKGFRNRTNVIAPVQSD